MKFVPNIQKKMCIMTAIKRFHLTHRLLLKKNKAARKQLKRATVCFVAKIKFIAQYSQGSDGVIRTEERKQIQL